MRCNNLRTKVLLFFFVLYNSWVRIVTTKEREIYVYNLKVQYCRLGASLRINYLNYGTLLANIREICVIIFI